jgi:hypothetical protein
MSLMWAADLAAITILTFGVFFPRHHRRDLVTAYLGVNVGVLAVASTLASVEVGVGLGLGLFGVLSIIRLRSDELGQQAVAYYFASLALGLLGGLSVGDPVVTLGLMALIVVVMYVADHPRLLGTHRSQLVQLDRAFTDLAALSAHLEALLGAQVQRVDVRKLDLVSDTTTVEVHYRVVPGSSTYPAAPVEPEVAWSPAGGSWNVGQGGRR